MEAVSIRKARRDADLTQAEIAKKLGVSVSTISLYETNKSDIPARKFIKFCEVVGRSRDDIFLPEITR